MHLVLLIALAKRRYSAPNTIPVAPRAVTVSKNNKNEEGADLWAQAVKRSNSDKNNNSNNKTNDDNENDKNRMVTIIIRSSKFLVKHFVIKTSEKK